MTTGWAGVATVEVTTGAKEGVVDRVGAAVTTTLGLHDAAIEDTVVTIGGQ